MHRHKNLGGIMDLDLRQGAWVGWEQWRFHAPAVFRYMDARYVRAFFENGTLRLSTVESFKKHQDERFQDTTEGSIGEAAKVHNFHIVNRVVLPPAFILCGSTLQEPRKWGHTGALVIRDTGNFAHAVAQKIEGFYGGFQGACIYSKPDTIEVEPEAHHKKQFENLMDGILASLGDGDPVMDENEYFLRKHQRFISDFEYRLVWYSGKYQGNYIDIEVPDAVKFCRAIYWDD